MHDFPSVFYSGSWQQIYPPHQLHRCLIVNANDEVIGAFQFFEFRKFGFRCFITPPFMPSIQLIYRNPAESVVGKQTVEKEVANVLADYFLSLKPHLMDVALPVAFNDSQPFTWKGFVSKRKYTYLLDLTVTEEQLLQQLSSEKRKSLTKANKAGLVAQQITKLDEVLNLVKATLKRNAALVNVQQIEQIISPLNSQHLVVFGVYANNQLIATTVCVNEANALVYLFGGTDTNGAGMGAGVMCMWQSILYAKQQHKTVFDFEGSMQPGIERYFREFGGTLTNYIAVEKQHWLLALLMKLKRGR